MTETEFIALVEKTFDDLENQLEDLDLDLDIERQGHVLTVEIVPGFKVVINRQTPFKQVWLASLKGGYRFDWNGQSWIERQHCKELKGVLSELLSSKLGQKVELA